VKKATYFSDLKDTTLRSFYPAPEPVIEPNDILNISVNSLNQEASKVFNAPNSSNITYATSQSTINQATGYLVNQNGYIQFPIIGNIKVAGLTEEELKSTLTEKLTSNKLLMDPLVNIRLLNFKVTVLGEVRDPKVITVQNEKISILEAIGLAGDLTIYGKRNNVLLIRQENGKKIIRRINLNSDKILTSPYFYLKNNDIVYIEPNKARVASSSRSQVILPIVFSILSFLTVVATYWRN
jgi:polysaccharide export outer membrane protein